MNYTVEYQSPVGPIVIASDGRYITGLWFSGQKHFGAGLKAPLSDGSALPALQAAMSWLDSYWQGMRPSPFDLPLLPDGTPFQQKIWRLLLEIPYGNCVTYADLAKKYAAQEGLPSMSAQAVGNAVGRNPISIIIPCHRVIGTNGSMTGYAGGISRKVALLRLEGYL